MKQYVIACLVCGLLINAISAQEIKVYESFEDFESVLLPTEDDTIYVINFWATWCAPCIKELPYFEEINQGEGNIKVKLVSLDFANMLESRLRPFVEQKGLKSEVIHLADPKVNSWIDKVDPNWSGSIPATYIYYGGQHIFLEKEYHSKEEILEDINSLNQ